MIRMISLLLALTASFFLPAISQVWNDWSPLGPCIAERGCGKGFKLSTRTCNSIDGTACTPGESYKTKRCFSISCYSGTAAWTDWTSWTTCNEKCDDGSNNPRQFRVRTCENGDIDNPECPGDVIGRRACPDVLSCPRKYDDCYDTDFDHSYIGIQDTDAGGTPCLIWADTTAYTPTIFPEAALTNNYCRIPTGEEPSCVTAPDTLSSCGIPLCGAGASWDQWSEWSTCSKTCGTGRRHRVRQCSGGDVNQGVCNRKNTKQSENCNTDTCPVFCMKDGSLQPNEQVAIQGEEL